MKIVVDAMGGDKAPMEIVKGSLLAVKKFNTDVILVGSGEDILRCIQSMGMTNLPKGIEIAHTSEIITMEDDPRSVVKGKKDSSMSVALGLLKDSVGDALVSAGSTGALLSGATLIVKRIKGIRRAALAPLLPSDNGGCIVIDSGANTDCTPEYLIQFAYMGASYAKHLLGKSDPKVALLNIGEEESKGLQLQRDVYAYLNSAKNEGKINFIGNIEARDTLTGKADVIVCDGFSGNIMLKSLEGVGIFIIKELKTAFKKSILTRLAYVLVKKNIGKLRRKLDYTEVGGSILLGVSKPVIKAHGSSDAHAICNAIGQAIRLASSGMIEEISAHIEDMTFSKEK